MRSALRSFATAPALTAVVVIVLALGIGANTAIFSLLDEALVQELPVSDPQQLRSAVVMSQDGATMSNVPAELFAELRREPRAFSGVLGSWTTDMNLDAGAEVDRVLVQYVSGGYFSTLGVSMFAGRAIRDADEDAPERPAVLSHRFWMRRFGGDPDVLGRAVLLNGLPRWSSASRGRSSSASIAARRRI
jgi:putative ABC transport system permease protein